jgi:hypothetical protein
MTFDEARLMSAIQSFPPDQRRQVIDNALRLIEKEERDQKAWEWFRNLPIEEREALYGKQIGEDKAKA